jgi:hypothetical protein
MDVWSLAGIQDYSWNDLCKNCLALVWLPKKKKRKKKPSTIYFISYGGET